MNYEVHILAKGRMQIKLDVRLIRIRKKFSVRDINSYLNELKFNNSHYIRILYM